MTEQEWQERYMITSTKGVIWKRREVAKRAVDMAYGLLMGEHPRTTIRAVIESLLGDDTFTRRYYGMVPARIVEDLAWEAFFKLAPKAKAEAKP